MDSADAHPERPGAAALALARVTGMVTVALPFLAGARYGTDLSVLCIGASFFQLRRPSARWAVATFLPAVVLAAWIALRDGIAAPGTGTALVAVAVAFQARVWLFGLAAIRRDEVDTLRRSLAARKPDKAAVFVDNDIESQVSPDTLREGHIFRVAPGQVLPADGVVTFGSGFVDDSFGGTEDLRLKGMGSPVYAGSTNRNGSLLVRTTASGANTFVARLAASLGKSTDSRSLLLPDLAGFAVAAALGLVSGPAAALPALLVSSLASTCAALGAFDFSLARASAQLRWLWADRGLPRLARAGMLVTTAPGVLTEGRPKLAAVETNGALSEDAALGLLGPLARKIETPAAFAVLLELRARNIPLQLAEFYEPLEGGGLVVVGGEEVRWVQHGEGATHPALGPLEAFVQEHESAGEEVCLLERQGAVQAAFAFRDAPLRGTAEAAEALRHTGYPVLLVSPLPKRCTARMVTEHGLEHAQGESRERETEALVARLANEKLAPAWLQTGTFHPARASAIVALAAATPHADLLLPEVTLPDVAAALAYARGARRRLRFAIGGVLGCHAGLLAALLGANAGVSAFLHLGEGFPVSPLAAALAGALPGFVAFFAAHSRACTD